MRRLPVLLALLSISVIFGQVLLAYSERTTLSPLAEFYLLEVPEGLGAANIVTGILITFRGFDTLGEVAVLFMVAASVGILLVDGPRKTSISQPPADPNSRPPSELIETGMQLVLPLIILFGVYVIVNGHLSAGGGFQGGAIVASGVMLLLLARPAVKLSHAFLSVTESIAGVFYVLIGILGIVFADGFLDSRLLPKGDFGALLSAGAIPVISLLLGIKVGAELSVIIDRFRNREG